MNLVSAEIIIKLDGSYRERVIRFEADNLKQLKRKMHDASFLDLDGENVENLKQWKKENL